MKKTALFLIFFTALCISTMAQSHQTPAINSSLTACNTSHLTTGNIFFKNGFDDPITKDHDFYIQKSKNQRTAGWVLLSAGVGLSGIGLLIGTNRNASFDQAATGAVITGIGALSGIISIPFMIMAGVNKHKAKVMLTNQKTGFGLPPNVSKDIVGITVKIPIGK